MERDSSAERRRRLPMRRRAGARRPSGRLTGSGAHQSPRRRGTAPSPLSCCHGTRRPGPPTQGEAWDRHGGASIAPQAPPPPPWGSPMSPGVPRVPRVPNPRHLPGVEGALGLLQDFTTAGPAVGRWLLGLAHPPESGPGASPALPQPHGLITRSKRDPASHSPAALAGSSAGRSHSRTRSFASGPSVSQWRGWESSQGIAS